MRRSFREPGACGATVAGFSVFVLLPLVYYRPARAAIFECLSAPAVSQVNRLFFLCSVLGVAANNRTPSRLDAWLSRRALLATCAIQLS